MNLLLLAGAILFTIFIFMLLVRVVKATIKTAFLIALFIFALQFIGIGPDKVLEQVIQIVQLVFPSK
jgi:hypothetical protein